MNIYSIDKYFEYCKDGNIAAVYFCLTVGGINPNTTNEEDGNRDAFMYGCENNRVDML